MQSLPKPNRWVGVDIDGTLADHYWPDKGPYDPFRIGEPVPIMVERVRAWLAHGIDVRIFTARVGPAHPAMPDIDIGAVEAAIKAWCLKHIGTVLPVTCTKDWAMAELWDDRAVRVVHNTGDICCGHASIPSEGSLTHDLHLAARSDVF